MDNLAIWVFAKNVPSCTVNLNLAPVDAHPLDLRSFVELSLLSARMLATKNYPVATNVKTFAIMGLASAMNK